MATAQTSTDRSADARARVVSEVIKAYDVRGLVGEQLDEAFVRDVGAAFARLLTGEAGTPPHGVVVAHDMRESSPWLAAAFAEGVTGQGVDVIDIGLASTDMLYYASGSLDAPGAMFTASHNPAAYNGIKLCRAGASPVGQDSGLDEIAALLDRAPGEVLTEDAPSTPGTVSRRDLLEDYAAFLRSLVDLSGIRRLTVVVDAGNGMAGYTVPAVLGELDELEIEPLYFELDGSFPNHEANPLDPDNLVDLQRKVRTVGRVDAGLAFDGDADRVFVVDENGDAVSPSAITALVATRELAGEPGASVIHNLITSRAVPEIISEAGGTPVRTRVGHSFIKATMAETGAIFGGEHSAHYYFRDFWRADSGMLAALHVLAALGGQDRPLSELMAQYTRYAASGEVNSTVPDPRGRMAAVEEEFGSREGVTIDALDGLTVTLPDGAWFNLRPSNTEPLLRLNVEAADDDAVATLRDEVLDLVRR